MKYTLIPLLIGLLFVPSLSHAATLTQAQRATILQEIASLESQIQAIADTQTSIATYTNDMNSALNDITVQKNRQDVTDCNQTLSTIPSFKQGAAGAEQQADIESCAALQQEIGSIIAQDQKRAAADEQLILQMTGASISSESTNDSSVSGTYDAYHADGSITRYVTGQAPVTIPPYGEESHEFEG